MFQINNEVWNIEFIQPHSSILMNDNGEYTLAVTVPEYHCIYVADDIDGLLLRHVLAHELWHAEMVSRGVYVPTYIEEALCDVIADHALDVYEILCKLERS